jgi:hypothetical protein
MIFKEPIKKMEIQAVIIRKDGTREDLGVISYWHSNIFKRLMWRVKNGLKLVYMLLSKK